MKKIILSAVFAMVSLFTIAQEKQKEIGINFESLNGFGITYRSGTAKSLWRYNLLSTNVGKSNNNFEQVNAIENSSTNNSTNINLMASFGKEFRKPITKNLEYRYGADIGFSYFQVITKTSSNFSNIETKSNNYSPSINAVLGVNYLINKNISFGVEILPSVRYSFGNNESTNDGEKIGETNNESWSIGLNNDFARLSLIYRF